MAIDEIHSTRNYYYEYGKWDGKPAILKVKRDPHGIFKESVVSVYTKSPDYDSSTLTMKLKLLKRNERNV